MKEYSPVAPYPLKTAEGRHLRFPADRGAVRGGEGRYGIRQQDIMDFSEKLLTLRKANDLTQEQLAEKLDVSRQSISK